MKQQTFTDIEYSNRKHLTKRDEFLKIMNDIIPWDEWVAFIKPVYFDNKVGRPARGIEIMLRMFLLQAWFNLSDEAVEDAVYDSYAMRSFMNIDFMTEQVPDATTLCKFRKLLVDNDIAKILFNAISGCLEEHGHMMRGGTVVDATIIEAPTSTKNLERKRDPEMHQTKKGNQWHFGMKTYIGVDAGSGYIHSVTATAANEHDITQAHDLIRDDDEVVYGDAGYTGIEKRDEIASDPHTSQIEYRINRRPGKLNKLPEGLAREFEKYLERRKSSVRSKVEYAFLMLKRQFGYRKTVYRGITKNLHRIQILLCSANLLMCARSGGWRTI
jgi:IS5 family transposase